MQVTIKLVNIFLKVKIKLFYEVYLVFICNSDSIPYS